MGAESSSRDYIVAGLRNGFNDSQIAQALGVTQSAISQAIDAHGLRELANANSKFIEHDEKLNDLESTVLTKLEKSIQHAILDPLKLTAIYKTLNGAKRRSLAEGQNLGNNNVQLVNINLPRHVQVKVGLNSRNEVVEVEGRPLLTLPAGKLVSMAGTQLKGSLSHHESENSVSNLRVSAPSISDIL